MRSVLFAIVALTGLLVLPSIAEAGCHGCRVRVVTSYPIIGVPCWRPVCQPVVIQPQPVQVQTQTPAVVEGEVVRRIYRTPVRDALFGRYRVVVPVQPVCPTGGCNQPVQPLPVETQPVGPSVKVEAGKVEVEVTK